MSLLKKLLCLATLLIPFSAYSQQKINLSSPDGNIQFNFQLSDSLPSYNITYKGKKIVAASTLSLSFLNSGDFGKDVQIINPQFRDGTDNYSLVVGKTSKVYDQYKEVTIPLVEQTGNKRKINLIVRVFNDGLAFRYDFPAQPNWSSFIMTDENTTFNLANNPTALVMFLPNFTSSHENRYTCLPLNKIIEDTLMDMPALFEFPDHIYMAITEAELVDYAGMYLMKHHGILKSQLSPWPGQSLVKVKATLPHQSPWRVFLISDKVGDLIASNIITDLNAPCKIKDVSWIKPGKTDFHWWNGDISPDTTFAPGINFDFNKYYIDFCAANNIQYHTVIGYGGTAWYQNDGDSYAPGPHTDVTKPVASLDMQQVCDYAKQKGVGIRVWVHWQALYPKIDTAFALFEKWGIKGMMVDFLNRDDQQMVNIQTEILQKAAEHHLHIQFHGAYKPTGLYRTYPNEFTREGTLNYENDKWGDSITANDDMNVAFTRLLAGPTDYHLGGFRAIPTSKYKIQYTRPYVLSTRCHMLAMYVILESYLQMVCDYPEAYKGQKGFDFIKEVPTVWDETKVPTANAGNWLTIARRKGSDWYVGTINNTTEKDIIIPFDFLPKGTTYTATIYEDAPDADAHPNHLVEKTMLVKQGDHLKVHLAASGGQVMKLTRN